MNRNTILVTGGAGFIGANLCLELVKDPNNYVVCLDNLYTGSNENVDEIKEKYDNYEFINGDILDLENLLSLSRYNFNQIYHLACPASPPAYQKDRLYTIKIGTYGSFNIIELALLCNARILFSSTSEIYGDPLEHPQKETYWGNVNTLGPRSNYDESKRISETIFHDSMIQRELNMCIVRIFNTYGPRMSINDGRVVTNFINQVLLNEDITIYGDGSQTRSICYIDDLIRGLISAMQSTLWGPFNLGNPEEYTVKQIAEKIITLTSSNSQLTYLPLPKDDPHKRKPDISEAIEKLNWCPTIDANTGLQKTIEWFKKSFTNVTNIEKVNDVIIYQLQAEENHVSIKEVGASDYVADVIINEFDLFDFFKCYIVSCLYDDEMVQHMINKNIFPLLKITFNFIHNNNLKTLAWLSFNFIADDNQDFNNDNIFGKYKIIYHEGTGSTELMTINKITTIENTITQMLEIFMSEEILKRLEKIIDNM